jgi:diguanylate cyclase
MKINTIIKNAISRLNREGKLITPEYYLEAFCLEAKKEGVLTDDCSQLDKNLKALDKKYQDEISNYNLKTSSELMRFLVSKLNRMEPSRCTQILELQTKLTFAILEATKILHNKEASKLATKTATLLSENAMTDQYEQIRQAWVNFTTVYDDAFLEKLHPYTKLDFTDLESTINSLDLNMNPRDAMAELSAVVDVITSSLQPSIAPSINDEISAISINLKSDPKSLLDEDVQALIKRAITLRISLDRTTFKKMVGSLDKILGKLSEKIIALIESSDESNVEIKKIKEELQSVQVVENKDFKDTHKRLFSIATTLEEKTHILSEDLKVHKASVKVMGERILVLEAQLKEAEKSSREDFLTKLFNKRALEEYMQLNEDNFKRHAHNYSIIIFDIDFFKKVNDTKGHDAGDAVLSAFAKVLKNECRKADIVGRYGGEEFMAILSDTSLDGAIEFANKVRVQVEKTKFMYKSERIEVTVSGGVAQRSDHSSTVATIKEADDKLYSAKNGGRNRIEPQHK